MADKQSLLEEAEEYLGTICPFLVVTGGSLPTQLFDNMDAVVISSVKEAIQWAKQLKTQGKVYEVVILL